MAALAAKRKGAPLPRQFAERQRRMVNQSQIPFSNMSNSAILALGRIAKNRKKGAYAFFRYPKNMIALREEIERRKL